MIVKKILLLCFGAVLIAGCQPSRSQDARLPISPQLGRVQTPVLHAMPVRGESDASSQWVEQEQRATYSSLGTYASSPTYSNPFVLHQPVGGIVDQVPVSSTQMIPLQFINDQGAVSRGVETILPTIEPTQNLKLDYSDQNSSWIQEAQTVELSRIDQAGFMSTNDSLLQKISFSTAHIQQSLRKLVKT